MVSLAPGQVIYRHIIPVKPKLFIYSLCLKKYIYNMLISELWRFLKVDFVNRARLASSGFQSLLAKLSEQAAGSSFYLEHRHKNGVNLLT